MTFKRKQQLFLQLTALAALGIWALQIDTAFASPIYPTAEQTVENEKSDNTDYLEEHEGESEYIENMLNDPNLFDGDNIISEEELERKDNEIQTTNIRKRRTVRAIWDHFWRNGIVPYEIGEGLHEAGIASIRRGMKVFEQLSCVRFIPHTDEIDYLYIKTSKGCGSAVGRNRGGGRTQTALSRCSGSQSAVIHELLHALGFFHEESRPDRDEYIQAKNGTQLPNKQLYVDTFGTAYDFNSAMLTIARKRINIINQDEYEKQGKPVRLGSIVPSTRDLIKLNRQYNCPESGIPGDLVVYINDTGNLPRNKIIYINVTAYDDSRQSVTMVTPDINTTNESNVNPNLNETMFFGHRVSWQYIIIAIMDRSTNQSLNKNLRVFSVNPGHKTVDVCGLSPRWDRCSNVRMNFTMSLSDTGCHCFSGGTCLPNGSCECPTGYGGPRCRRIRGRLSVSLDNATNLRYRPYGGNNAFLRVRAYNFDGYYNENDTEIVSGVNPVWNEQLDFGVGNWGYFTVTLLDFAGRPPNRREKAFSTVYTYVLARSLGSEVHTQIEGRPQGKVNLRYLFEQEN